MDNIKWDIFLVMHTLDWKRMLELNWWPVCSIQPSFLQYNCRMWISRFSQQTGNQSSPHITLRLYIWSYPTPIAIPAIPLLEKIKSHPYVDVQIYADICRYVSYYNWSIHVMQSNIPATVLQSFNSLSSAPDLSVALYLRSMLILVPISAALE